MILVTGATGFIGREIVARLLAADRPLGVLARGRDGADARTRVAAALGDDAALERVEIVEGDLAALDVGLDPMDLRRLRDRVETVIHCAGDTSFAPDALAPYIAGHVEGPVALLRALAAGRLARWAHVSTAFVCGDRSGTVSEADGDVTQHRLILTESVYRNRLDHFWLRTLDPRFNHHRHAGRMPAALAFRTDAEWEALFASRHLRPVAARWLGSPLERLIHHPRLYVLDVPGD